LLWKPPCTAPRSPASTRRMLRHLQEPAPSQPFRLKPLSPLPCAALRQGQNARSRFENIFSLSPRLRIRGSSPKKFGEPRLLSLSLDPSLNVLSLTNLPGITCKLLGLEFLLYYQYLSQIHSV
jgi:hypothetical protein